MLENTIKGRLMNNYWLNDHVPFTQGREGVKVQVFKSYISLLYLG